MLGYLSYLCNNNDCCYIQKSDSSLNFALGSSHLTDRSSVTENFISLPNFHASTLSCLLICELQDSIFTFRSFSSVALAEATMHFGFRTPSNGLNQLVKPFPSCCLVYSIGKCCKSFRVKKTPEWSYAALDSANYNANLPGKVCQLII